MVPILELCSWQIFSLVSRVRSSHAESPDALEDLIGGLGPNEGLGAAVVGREVFTDSLLELGGAAMSAAANLPLGERGEPSLDLIEPRGRAHRVTVVVASIPL